MSYSNNTIETGLGTYLNGDSVELLSGPIGKKLKGKVQLILTSPPISPKPEKEIWEHTG